MIEYDTSSESSTLQSKPYEDSKIMKSKDSQKIMSIILGQETNSNKKNLKNILFIYLTSDIKNISKQDKIDPSELETSRQLTQKSRMNATSDISNNNLEEYPTMEQHTTSI